MGLAPSQDPARQDQIANYKNCANALIEAREQIEAEAPPAKEKPRGRLLGHIGLTGEPIYEHAAKPLVLTPEQRGIVIDSYAKGIVRAAEQELTIETYMAAVTKVEQKLVELGVVHAPSSG